MKKIVEESELKTICKDVLKQFDDYCKKHELQYFLGYGTALGAVRHKGFIPWDDDIDVIMPRSDYEKLLSCYNENPISHILLCHERDNEYNYPFAKLCDPNTELVEEHFANDTNMGIYIDIFPIDGLPSDIKAAQKHLKKCIRIQHKLNHAMSKHFFRSNANLFIEVIRYIRYRILKFVGPEFFYNMLEKYAKKYNYDNAKFVSNCVWCVYSTKEIFDKSIFNEKILVDFENEKYPLVKDYDLYLRSIYDNYMKLPPVEKQISHHDMIAYYKD